MATLETVLIGDRVRYESATGTIYGEVVKIMRAPNAAGELINWIYVEYHNEKSPCNYSISRLAETSLEMMKFAISDYDNQDTHNEKAAA
jgi:hypothetical protein